MRILESHVAAVSGHTYAVIVNPIAGGLCGHPAHRYRLICARIPDWIIQVNTVRSVSRTPGIQIYETFDVLEAWEGLESTDRRVNKLLREARVLGGAVHLIADRRSP